MVRIRRGNGPWVELYPDEDEDEGEGAVMVEPVAPGVSFLRPGVPGERWSPIGVDFERRGVSWSEAVGLAALIFAAGFIVGYWLGFR